MSDALVAKGKGEKPGVGDELPDNAPRRNQLLGMLALAPALGGATLALTNGGAGGFLMRCFNMTFFAVFPLAMVFVGGYFVTAIGDGLLGALDRLLWPALRRLGRALADSFRDGNRVSPFLRDQDPIHESRSIRAFIPDAQWVPSVGGLVAVHTVFLAWALGAVAQATSGGAVLGLGLLAAWAVVYALVLRLGLRTAAGRYRLVIGMVWLGQELAAGVRRAQRRSLYASQPALQLEPGAVPDQIACPYCSDPIGDAPAVACEACHTPHHADCWAAFGRCTVYACTGEVERRIQS